MSGIIYSVSNNANQTSHLCSKCSALQVLHYTSNSSYCSGVLYKV